MDRVDRDGLGGNRRRPSRRDDADEHRDSGGDNEQHHTGAESESQPEPRSYSFFIHPSTLGVPTRTVLAKSTVGGEISTSSRC